MACASRALMRGMGLGRRRAGGGAGMARGAGWEAVAALRNCFCRSSHVPSDSDWSSLMERRRHAGTLLEKICAAIMPSAKVATDSTPADTKLCANTRTPRLSAQTFYAANCSGTRERLRCPSVHALQKN